MNLTIFSTKDYENISDWTLGENKPNSNPIKPNLKRAKMNANDFITKDYRKKDDFSVRINKPNSNPISKMPKMNVNLTITKDYRKNDVFEAQKTNPIKPNFRKAKIPCRKIRPHPALDIFESILDASRPNC